MSIVGSFKKIVDPIKARQDEMDRKRQRETKKEDESGAKPLFTCRVCGTEDHQGEYCPICLADTMITTVPETI